MGLANKIGYYIWWAHPMILDIPGPANNIGYYITWARPIGLHIISAGPVQ